MLCIKKKLIKYISLTVPEHFINGSGDTKVREETRPHFLQGAYLQAFRRTPNQFL